MLSSSLPRLLPPSSSSSFLSFLRHKGHSKWQNIQHIKKEKDTAYGRLSNQYVQLIGRAIKENGNEANPKLNTRLAKVIEEAKTMNVTNVTIDRCLKRAASKDFEATKDFIVEVRGPGRTAIVVEAQGVRFGSVQQPVSTVLRKFGGLTEPGVASMFQHVGLVVARAEAMTLDRAEEVAIECEANDVEETADKEFVFSCDPRTLPRVKKGVEEGGMEVTMAEAVYDPRTRVAVGSATRKKVFELLAKLEDLDVVMATHHNMEVKS